MGFGIQGYISPNNPLFGSVVTDESGLKNLLDYAKSNLLTSAQYGDWSNWVADVIFYPFTIGVFSAVYDDIYINGVNTDVPGITLGSDKRATVFDFSSPFVIFINESPSTILYSYGVNSTAMYSMITTEIFLPYYGWAQVPSTIYRYEKISCFLALEPRMGYGTYYICGHSISLTHSNGNLDNNSQIQQIEIIQAIPVQIGTHIPYGSDGQAQVNRNVINATSAYATGLTTTALSGISSVGMNVAAGNYVGAASAVVGTVGSVISKSANYSLDMGIAQQQNASTAGGLSGQYCTYTDIYPAIRITLPNVQQHELTLADTSGDNYFYGYNTQQMLAFRRMLDKYSTGEVYRSNLDITKDYSTVTLLQADNVTFGYYHDDYGLLPEEYDMLRALLSSGVWLPSTTA